MTTLMIPKKNHLFKIFPLIIFFLLILLAFIALQNYDRDNLPSVLVGKPPPPLFLEEFGSFKKIDETDLIPIKQNKIRLINFWASWCPPCRVEHPQLEKLSRSKNIEIFGINYKDNEMSALNFLNNYGNPFTKIGSDKLGRNAIEWGVYGVPETFLIDKNKVIRAKYIGVISEDIYYNEILPTIEKIKDDY